VAIKAAIASFLRTAGNALVLRIVIPPVSIACPHPAAGNQTGTRLAKKRTRLNSLSPKDQQVAGAGAPREVSPRVVLFGIKTPVPL